MLRLVDFGVATVATPGACGSGELSGAVSEHCATNREEEIRTPDWKCNRSRLKVKWRRVRLGVAGRNRIRYGMVVDYILFLASPKGRSITGSTHVIDAGRLVLSRSSTASALQDGSGKNYRK